MTHDELWLVTCPYCATKSVSTSQPSVFLHWFGHWAGRVRDGDTSHPNPPEPPSEKHYECLVLGDAVREHMGRQ